ncbi:hypothetical protein PLESTB_000902500 [Pleodorina starrii]|uniref:Uncharacterized protein n=1 Tax=Pleodorina starrii TaxID=330485 RepID=A0A9W6BMB4_9CHLO|nr:hypothetical protein PLESTM_001513900 [Pleodorina starrii]GLC54754.1 hypothetical protein PLESTB_000902500 [Pleodorina starrii]GLC68356.1 hypothetical protein PLESTF_000682400 [Pleodorina starrii]
MEKHHLLRRDPNWHPNGCNLCGQLGHQAANCPNGTINWRQIYGDEAFILRQPIYYSDIQERIQLKEDGMKDLEARAQAYAKAKAEELGLNWGEIVARAEELRNKDPSEVIPKAAPPAGGEDALPPGWAVATDPNGRQYFWHKKTQKVQWDRPTDDTPIN